MPAIGKDICIFCLSAEDHEEAHVSDPLVRAPKEAPTSNAPGQGPVRALIRDPISDSLVESPVPKAPGQATQESSKQTTNAEKNTKGPGKEKDLEVMDDEDKVHYI